jgi:hypothetical protein
MLSVSVTEIQARIQDLSNLFEEALTNEMDALKECLLQNPSAAALLKDEDVGLLVQNLRRTVATAQTEAAEAKASGRKPKAAAKKQFTAEELAAALAADGL